MKVTNPYYSLIYKDSIKYIERIYNSTMLIHKIPTMYHLDNISLFIGDKRLLNTKYQVCLNKL